MRIKFFGPIITFNYSYIVFELLKIYKFNHHYIKKKIVKKKILIIGASGMIGSALVSFFSKVGEFSVFGSIRSLDIPNFFNKFNNVKIFNSINLDKKNSLLSVINLISPDIVINCVGVVKQSEEIKNYYNTIFLNSLFPHYLYELSSKHSFRLIHISSDCVFSGNKGNYSETDVTDPNDLYGLTKLLGEIKSGNAITIRASLIGHEIYRKQGIVEWFLSQDGNVQGYNKAIFSGVTSIEFARIIYENIIPNHNLKGLYHISSFPISKYDLLLLIKNIYNKTSINIIGSNKIIINRSLNSSNFQNHTGYLVKEWPQMIKEMKETYSNF
jgi:dTDP-4-dehydrorhamnose reductase